MKYPAAELMGSLNATSLSARWSGTPTSKETYSTRTLHELVAGMNAIEPSTPLDYGRVERDVVARDRAGAHPCSKDLQLMAVRNARRYWPDRLGRVARPHRLLDPAHGPLIAVRLHLLTRKTLGGLETTLDC
ncbi:hypothetical protein ACWC2K_39150 [Streptomyces chattanoogensis]